MTRVGGLEGVKYHERTRLPCELERRVSLFVRTSGVVTIRWDRVGEQVYGIRYLALGSIVL